MNYYEPIRAEQIGGNAPHDICWYPEWTELGACRKISVREADNLFFEYGKSRRKIRRAKTICASCPVAMECLRDNLEVPFGIFGGTTALDRWRLRGRKGYPTQDGGLNYFTQFSRTMVREDREG